MLHLGDYEERDSTSLCSLWTANIRERRSREKERAVECTLLRCGAPQVDTDGDDGDNVDNDGDDGDSDEEGGERHNVINTSTSSSLSPPWHHYSSRYVIGCLYPPPDDWSTPPSTLHVRDLQAFDRRSATLDVFAWPRWRFHPPEHDRVETRDVLATAIACTVALWERSHPVCYEILAEDETRIMDCIASYDEWLAQE
eukprot:COSAG05_NODE_6581_length_934_cov_1.850299_2_plen_198_part_00